MHNKQLYINLFAHFNHIKNIMHKFFSIELVAYVMITSKHCVCIKYVVAFYVHGLVSLMLLYKVCVMEF